MTLPLRICATASEVRCRLLLVPCACTNNYLEERRADTSTPRESAAERIRCDMEMLKATMSALVDFAMSRSLSVTLP
jgi:hypothetical protein